MLRYVLKRLLIFIPTLVVVSLITFVISTNAPGDPIENMLSRNQSGGEGGQNSQRVSTEKAYNSLRHELGFDKPIFYFTLTNATYCDTLYKVPKTNWRETLEHLSYTYGNWRDVSKYFNAIRNFENIVYDFKKDSTNAQGLSDIRNFTTQLYDNYREPRIKSIFTDIENTINDTPGLKQLNGPYMAMKNGFEACVHNQSIMKRYIPMIYWYGTDNQYHHWITNFLCGDFGISYQDKRPVSSVILDALPNTMWLSLCSILIAYLLAIPIGVRSAVNKGQLREKSSTAVLYALYSLPNFWVATMLVIYLCGGDYLAWFPAPGSPP
ncbi:MAG TPA: ABC transporter permease, partial [Bacteroidia bacterium]